jgi:hypothetical protein
MTSKTLLGVHLSGSVNSQNYRPWSAHNPHNVIEVSSQSIKVCAWFGMSRGNLLAQSSLMKLLTLKDIEDSFLNHF